MNKFGKIFFVIMILIFTDHICFAQSVSQQKDTIKIKLNKTESVSNTDNQNTKEINNNQADKDNSDQESQPVKQVKSARPDMSRARGARPPDIVRPAGSRIPNGIGRPAGAIRPGHG